MKAVATPYNEGMQTCCPRCKTIIRSSGKEWSVLNASCPELAGTQWDGSPEYCPVLAGVVEPDVVLPGLTMRVAVQSEIDGIQVKKAR